MARTGFDFGPNVGFGRIQEDPRQNLMQKLFGFGGQDPSMNMLMMGLRMMGNSSGSAGRPGMGFGQGVADAFMGQMQDARMLEAQAYKPNALWFCLAMGLVAIAGGFLYRMQKERAAMITTSNLVVATSKLSKTVFGNLSRDTWPVQMTSSLR